MTAIVSNLLAAGGWELVVGWILPTALNSALFGLLVLPAWRYLQALHIAAAASNTAKALTLLVAAVVGGLVLSALQAPLYQFLEGYTWPARIRQRGIDGQLRRKKLVKARLRLILLVRQEQAGELTGKQAAVLARYWPRVRTACPSLVQDWHVSAWAKALDRYPIDDKQVLPSQLGNAIRRMEEYGYDRYNLDVLAMWYALTSAVSDQIRKDVGSSRAMVDFYVCLLYGHIVVALAAIATIAVVPGHAAGPAVAAAVGLVLPGLWYRLAVAGTDEWAAAVQALVDTGRQPLAESLGLTMPASLDLERQMWRAASRNVRVAYSARSRQLDQFRLVRNRVRGP